MLAIAIVILIGILCAVGGYKLLRFGIGCLIGGIAALIKN